MDFGFYNMDCMEGMKEFPDKYFELAIVDPPYGINVTKMNFNGNALYKAEKEKRKGRLNSGGGKLKNSALQTMNCDWDREPPKKEYFDELFRVSKSQIIWGGNYFELPPTRCIIVWDKVQCLDNFSHFELAWTSFDYPAAMFRQSNSGGSEKRIHPTQKPVALYKWLVTKYAKRGDKILDTHVGSASSLEAFHQLGYKSVGFELDKDYYAAAKKRLELVKAQLSVWEISKDNPSQQLFIELLR